MVRLETERRNSDWPAQVELIMSALDTGQYDANRRKTGRQSYRVKARLRLFSDAATSSPWVIYTRDIHTRGLGFISPHRLPLGYGGLVELPGPEGGVISINCTLSRCREAAPGWYEGALYFNREQAEFASPEEEVECA